MIKERLGVDALSAEKVINACMAKKGSYVYMQLRALDTKTIGRYRPTDAVYGKARILSVLGDLGLTVEIRELNRLIESL